MSNGCDHIFYIIRAYHKMDILLFAFCLGRLGTGSLNDLLNERKYFGNIITMNRRVFCVLLNSRSFIEFFQLNHHIYYNESLFYFILSYLVILKTNTY